ncbi:MAG: cation transporter [Candidatus Rokuibacteriota bacterium]
MTTCCDAPGGGGAGLEGRQRRVLQLVLTINAGMFLVELGAGLLAHSTALLADSLDMLGDALVYAFSLAVLGRGTRWQARAALLKGGIMAVFGLGVLGEVVVKALRGIVPTAAIIGGVGLLALVANLACLALLLRHRADDLNLRSTWVCSRNDVIANVGVLAAAAGVAFTGSAWPDIVIGAAIAGVFGASAVGVLRDATRQLQLVRSGAS